MPPWGLLRLPSPTAIRSLPLACSLDVQLISSWHHPIASSLNGKPLLSLVTGHANGVSLGTLKVKPLLYTTPTKSVGTCTTQHCYLTSHPTTPPPYRAGVLLVSFSKTDMTVLAPAQHDITVVKVRSRRTPGTERFNIARNGKLGLGNPHKIATEADRDKAVDAYRKDLWVWMNHDSPQRKAMEELLEASRQGPIELCCHCAPLRCHGDVIKSCLQWMHEHPHYQ